MSLQYLLTRRAINIAIGNALEDMQSNTRRSIRNMIDLSLLFSKSENHKQFFSVAKKVVANTKNPYTALAKRIIADMNTDAVKRIGVNLGYSSLTYGAGKLRKKQGELGEALPWLLIFDISESISTFFDQMISFIKDSRELGIYSYIVCPHNQDDILSLCKIAKSFEECLFGFKVPSSLISERTVEALAKTLNTTVCIQAAGDGFDCESDINAFRLLKENRCVYGFCLNYNDQNIDQVASPACIDAAIGQGNLFGVYRAEDGVSEACKDAVYKFVCTTRGENGQSLIALEWSRDMQYISDKIMSGEGYRAIGLTKKAHFALKRGFEHKSG